jgi:hypothetical protein
MRAPISVINSSRDLLLKQLGVTMEPKGIQHSITLALYHWEREINVLETNRTCWALCWVSHKCHLSFVTYKEPEG